MQDDWSDGALRPYWRPGDARYARSHNVDARNEGVLALGMSGASSDFLLQNGGAELGATTGWTAGQATHTTPAAAARTGSYGHRMVVSSCTTAQDFIRQALTN